MKKRIRILAVYLLLLGFAGSAVYAAKSPRDNKKTTEATTEESTIPEFETGKKKKKNRNCNNRENY